MLTSLVSPFKDYKDKCATLLKDTNTYRKLSKRDPTSKYKKELVAVLQKIEEDGGINRVKYRQLYPTAETTPKFYGLAKVHKAGIPSRPIFADLVKNERVEEDEELRSFDVTALFTSMPVDEALSVISQRLQEDPTLPQRTTLKPEHIVDLLQATHTDQYLNFFSNHPLDHKLGVIKTLLHRANTTISDPADRSSETAHVTEALKKCGYPQWLIRKASEPRQPRSKPQDSQGTGGKNRKTLVVLPYVKGVSEPLCRIFAAHGVSTCFRPHRTLRQVLVAPKDKTPKEDKCGVIYHISCQGNTNRGPCRETYIGETERSLKTRFLEHRRPSSVASEVSQHIHIESPGHTVDLEGVRILDTEQDYFKRGIKESIYIRALQPSLNRDGGRYRLQTTFDPLLTSHVGKITCPQHLGQIAEQD
ncbi:hypothetical protein Bbelb_197310 [Branchiostoma belcheri]|nr:hypothetical protein Bbelb_197310 [Branchiostoma belcheri]